MLFELPLFPPVALPSDRIYVTVCAAPADTIEIRLFTQKL